jgi:hypothetical protein
LRKEESLKDGIRRYKFMNLEARLYCTPNLLAGKTSVHPRGARFPIP